MNRYNYNCEHNDNDSDNADGMLLRYTIPRIINIYNALHHKGHNT